jgi:hypothetical protein
MRAILAALVFGSAALGATTYIIEGVAAHLDRAVARQCADQAWPAHQAQAHRAFCLAEGHSVGTAFRD